MDPRILRELELDTVASIYRSAAPVEETMPVHAEAAPPREEPAVRDIPIVPARNLGDVGWDDLRALVSECSACGLCKQRKQAVFGVGHPTAPWLFVGEGPGADEDEQGEPFVGQAGKLLDSMLTAINCKRGHEVYIANVVKCRPPGNRTPTPEEAAACSPYLDRQIELIGPRLIVALGKTAAMRLLGTDASLASLRGRVHKYRDVPVVVTYHPAYLLRTPGDKAKAWEDLVFARRTLAAAA